MNSFRLFPRLLALAVFVAPAAAWAADSYQVTGPVTEMTDTKIVVMKGKERFEIARTADSKVPADVKVGSKVTVRYTLTAVDVESKDKPAKADKPAAAAPAKPEAKK